MNKLEVEKEYGRRGAMVFQEIYGEGASLYVCETKSIEEATHVADILNRYEDKILEYKLQQGELSA